MQRRLVTIPAKWPYPASSHWVHVCTPLEKVIDKLAGLTPDELLVVAGKIADLLLVKGL